MALDEELVRRIIAIERELERTRAMATAGFVPLAAPLTSTSWDGDSFSTTAKTLIDLSAVFGVPAGVRAVCLRVTIRDSASAANDCWLIFGPTNTNQVGQRTRCSGLADDSWTDNCIVVPCDANGDVYYQVQASGSLTLEAYAEIWGYWQ